MTRFATIITSRLVGVTACVAATVGLGCGACGPSIDEDNTPELPSEEGRRYAGALCEAIETCGCAKSFDSVDACETEYHARFDKLLEAGFEVARECFDAWLDDINADPCGEQVSPPTASFPCGSLRRGKKKGAACEAHLGLVPLGVEVFPLLADECGDGLTCFDARCVETPPGTWTLLGAGDPCGATYADRCPWRVMYCDATEGVCSDRKALGAECSPGECEGCEGDGGESLYCQGATPSSPGTCATRPLLAESCDPLDIVACGGCGSIGWCDPATATCVEGAAPNLCASLQRQAR